MALLVRRNNNNDRPVLSGAVGGPSTGDGLNYQIKYAVLRALQLFPQVLSFALKNPSIRIEPRDIGDKKATRWDLGFESPDEWVEVKLNPTAQDLKEWMQRSGQAVSSESKLALVYSKAGGHRLAAVKQLIRIAKEAGSDDARFRALIELEEVPDADSLLKELGTTPLEILQRMKLVALPDHVLEERIHEVTTRLAGASSAESLRELIFAQVAEAVPHRGTIQVRDLVHLVGKRGIPLNTIPQVDIPDLPKGIRDAVLILNRCPEPLPMEILAQAVGTTSMTLQQQLEETVVRDAVLIAEGRWKLAPLPVALPHADVELCARGLLAILNFIQLHKNEPLCWRQVYNAAALARICAGERPEAVARMFISIDKAAKCLGDKHLVIDLAELTISSARRSSIRRREEVEGEAQAIICGKSWALQRIGRLEEAKLAAEASLRLGEAIGWDRNTAFCEKCMGRLHRIMAEQTNDPQKRRELLESSIRYLETAIARFSTSSEFGPGHPEVGDCCSLLGRTHLVAKNFKVAAQCVKKASALVPQGDGKDYLDLRILEGELLEADNREAAEICYSDVIRYDSAADSERSEIAGRAYFRRGINRAAARRRAAAVQDFAKAAELWTRLDEDENAARARWEILKIEEAVPSSVLTRLETESYRVRVSVVTTHQNSVAAFSGKRVARRSEPGLQYWEPLIKEARGRVAVESVEWC